MPRTKRFFARNSWDRVGELLDARHIKEPTGCWRWTASVDRNGYGLMRMPDEVLAHRVAYRAWKGEIPDGHCIRHACDNPPCINPDHLLVGTMADNQRDMVEHGRSCVGSRHWKARLNEEQVGIIRRLRMDHQLTHRAIASLFGVGVGAITAILIRKTWRHV